MEQDDEEFEKLLGEIPRATSAPPHLEELQRVYGQQLENGLVVQGGPDASPVAKPFADIRADELYDTFYRTYSGGKKLPPPIEGRHGEGGATVLSPNSAQLSPFFNGLDLDSPKFSGHNAPRQYLSKRPANTQAERRPELFRPQPLQHSNRETALTSSFSSLSLGNASPSREVQARYASLGESSAAREDSRDRRGSGESADTVKGQAPGRTLSIHGVPMPGDDYSSGGSSAALNGFGSSSSLDRYTAGPTTGLVLPPKRSSSVEALGQRPSAQDSYQSSGLDQYYVRKVPSAAELYTSSSSRGVAGGSLDSYAAIQAAAEVYQNAAAMQQAAARLGYPLSGGGSQTNLEAHAATAALQAQQQGQGVNSALPLDSEMAVLYQAQQRATQMALLQAQLRQDEERLRQRVAQQQQLLAQAQQQQALAVAVAQGQQGRYLYDGGQGYVRGSSPPRNRVPNGAPQMLGPHQVKGRAFAGAGMEPAWSGQGSIPPSDPRSPVMPGGICRFYVQGYCSRGDACPFLHTLPSGVQVDPSFSAVHGLGPLPREARGPHPSYRQEEARYQPSGPLVDKLAMARRMRQGHLSPRRRSEGSLNLLAGHDASSGHPHHSQSSYSRPLSRLSDDYDSLDGGGGRPHHSPPLVSQSLHLGQQQKYTSLEEVEGRIYQIAKDQHGCRFLQKKFDEGGPEDVEKIFREIIDHIVELMTDPFGNYLIQKLLECCSEYQRCQVLDRVAHGPELVTISLNMHGTRAVQKLIETLTSGEQVELVISALKPGVVTLIKDLNGNHVIQRCLQRLSNEDNQFIFDAAAAHCVEIATHRHGCCVLQRCVDFASGVQRQRLVAEIAANALVLSQDPFGNYVVQYVLDLGMPWASAEVIIRLEGNYPYLAMQKFSSNVVEKCLKLAGEEHRARITRELVHSPRLGQLLQDPYANYVVQSALTVSKGPLHAALVDAIRPHLPALRSSPYGKRILSRTNIKK